MDSIDNSVMNIVNVRDIKHICTDLNQRKNTLYFSTTSNALSAKYFWNIIDSKLDVYSFEQSCNNRLVASFNFGQIFNETNILITNVIRLVDRFEIGSIVNYPHKLIAVLSLSNSRNLICLLDIRLNSIVNTIDFPFEITSIEMITSKQKSNVENMPLINELLCMNGCLAVGCEGGLVFFIDLILDSYSPEPLIPKKISILTPNSNVHMDLDNKRRTAIFHNQVLCVTLNIEAKNKGKFNYRSDDGTIMASYAQNQVYISTLHYIPQLSVICVGYNFGGFHLYNLKTFIPDCSCGVDESLLPVISFAFQSPENDPKNYSYLWVVRGFPYRIPNVLGMQQPNGITTSFVYLLCYKEKKYLKNYGILYDTFKLCLCKFEMPLKSKYLTDNHYDGNQLINKYQSSITGSRLIDMFTIHQIMPIMKTNDNDCDDEELSTLSLNVIDYNYLIIAWETFNSSNNSNNRPNKNQESNYYFCIFDLNQWYKAQMPKNYYVDQNNLCPFISIYSLNPLVKRADYQMPATVQAIHISNMSLTKYHSNMFYQDIHSYPISLTFNMIVATNSQLFNVTYYGLQKRLLKELSSNNSSIKHLMSNCKDILVKCIKYGLLSALSSINEANDHQLQQSIAHQDDYENMNQILTIALENNLHPLLINFIDEIYNENDDNDNTENDHLKLMFLEWIWAKITAIKNSIDKICEIIFDSYYPKQDIIKLNSYENHLELLSILLKRILEASIEQTSNIDNINFDKLKARIDIVELIQYYLKFIIYFENNNYLPEQQSDIVSNDDHQSNNKSTRKIYPYKALNEFYVKRRKELNDLSGENYSKNNNGKLLSIDILCKCLQPFLSKIWNNDNNDDEHCIYPPKNLYSLLKIFLINSNDDVIYNNISIEYKKFIIVYFFYDLSNDHRIDDTNLMQTIRSINYNINIDNGIELFIKCLWLLDHKHYDAALKLLIHPTVIESMAKMKNFLNLFDDLIPNIIELFILDSQIDKSLTFVTNFKHILIDNEMNENLYLQILLLNNDLKSAIEFQRQRRSIRMGKYSHCLLYKIFFICEKLNILIQICKINLDEYEEKIFIEYLQQSKNHQRKSSKIILILYYLLQNKILNAINIVKQYENEFYNNFDDDDDDKNILELIDAYISILPSATIDLAKQLFKLNDQGNNKTKNAGLNKFSKLKTSNPTLCLSPRFTKNIQSKIIKKKNPKFRKLFQILLTPDMKKSSSSSSAKKAKNQLSINDNLLTKKPILKLTFNNDNNDNDGHSDLNTNSNHNRHKVSFLNDDDSNSSSCTTTSEMADDNNDNEELNLSSRFSANNRRTKIGRKQLTNMTTTTLTSSSSPSSIHRMKLRSNRKN